MKLKFFIPKKTEEHEELVKFLAQEFVWTDE